MSANVNANAQPVPTEGAGTAPTRVLTVSEGTDTIQSYHFRGQSDITEIWFPPSLRVIGMRAFWVCKGITRIDLSGTALTAIKSRAFSGCEALEVVVFPDSLASILWHRLMLGLSFH